MTADLLTKMLQPVRLQLLLWLLGMYMSESEGEGSDAVSSGQPVAKEEAGKTAFAVHSEEAQKALRFAVLLALLTKARAESVSTSSLENLEAAKLAADPGVRERDAALGNRQPGNGEMGSFVLLVVGVVLVWEALKAVAVLLRNRVCKLAGRNRERLRASGAGRESFPVGSLVELDKCWIVKDGKVHFDESCSALRAVKRPSDARTLCKQCVAKLKKKLL